MSSFSSTNPSENKGNNSTTSQEPKKQQQQNRHHRHPFQHRSPKTHDKGTEFDVQLDNDKILVSSWLYKRSHKTHQWQKRWCVLRNCQLSYYKNSSEYKPSKVINKSNLLSYSSIPDCHKFHFAIYTNNKVIHLKSDDTNTYDQWLSALELFISENDDENVSEGDDEHDDEKDQNVESSIIEPNDESNETLIRSNLSAATGPPPTNVFPKSVTSHMNTDYEFSGEDQYLSSGISDSPLSPNDHEVTSFPPFPALLEHLAEDQDEDDITQGVSSLGISSTTNTYSKAKSPYIQDEELPHVVKSSHSEKANDDKEFIIEQGSLLRLRKRYNQWRKLYVILTNKNVYFHKSKADFSNPYRCIPLSDLIDVIELDPLSKTKIWCLLMITPLKRLRFCADTEEDMIKWLSTLKTLILKERESKKSKNS